MSDSDQPWSNGPNAPQIPYSLYTQEKEFFGAAVIAAVSYGIVVTLFFQCMNGLLFTIHPTTKGVRWGLVAHTVVMFSLSTIGFAIDRNIFSISYVNGREFTGLYPGPLGFLYLASPLHQAIGYFAYLTFPFTQWLADGLLVYRCFVIYSMNRWAIALPSLMYLASIVASILWFHAESVGDTSLGVHIIAYFSICVSLNILITLMIIIRLVLHSRNIRNAFGASSGLGGLYTAVITMLVESSALNTAGYLLWILYVSVASLYFSPPLGEIQVTSVFLITLRVTNRTALTSEAVASGDFGSIRFRNGGGSTGAHVSSNGETSGQIGVGVETGFQET